MYAYAKRANRATRCVGVAASALAYRGEKIFYWTTDKAAHAVRTEVRTGVADDEWVEIVMRQVPPGPDGIDPWVGIDGSESVIVGDLSVLAEGEKVSLAK